MRIEPLGDKIVIKRLNSDEQTSGGIFIPEASRERPQQGRVLSVGHGTMTSDGVVAKPQINEGDRVIFASYVGNEIEINGEKLLILKESEVLAVID